MVGGWSRRSIDQEVRDIWLTGSNYSSSKQAKIIVLSLKALQNIRVFLPAQAMCMCCMHASMQGAVTARCCCRALARATSDFGGPHALGVKSPERKEGQKCLLDAKAGHYSGEAYQEAGTSDLCWFLMRFVNQ